MTSTTEHPPAVFPRVYDVRWHPSDLDADDAIRRHCREVLGDEPVRLTRHCAQCGSTRHGRPRLTYANAPQHVSLARSGPHLVTVLAKFPVGIDVEVDFIEVDPTLVLAPGETGELARVWARMEAILKARGTGLTTPMSSVVLAHEHWTDLTAPIGFVAAVSLAYGDGNGGNAVAPSHDSNSGSNSRPDTR